MSTFLIQVGPSKAPWALEVGEEAKLQSVLHLYAHTL